MASNNVGHGQGDRKGPHPAPHHSRPYNDYEGYHMVAYHCKGGSGVERGGDPCGRPGGGSAPPPPVATPSWAPGDPGGGSAPPPPVGSPSWDRGALAGRYGSGSQLTLSCGLSSSRLSNYLLVAHVALNRRLADEEDCRTYEQRKNT